MALMSDWDRSLPSKRPPLVSDFLLSFWKDCTGLHRTTSISLDEREGVGAGEQGFEIRPGTVAINGPDAYQGVFGHLAHTPLLACRRVRRSDISLMDRPLKSRTSASSPRRESLELFDDTLLVLQRAAHRKGSDRGNKPGPRASTRGRCMLLTPRSSAWGSTHKQPGGRTVSRTPRQDLQKRINRRTGRRSHLLLGRARALLALASSQPNIMLGPAPDAGHSGEQGSALLLLLQGSEVHLHRGTHGGGDVEGQRRSSSSLWRSMVS